MLKLFKKPLSVWEISINHTIIPEYTEWMFIRSAHITNETKKPPVFSSVGWQRQGRAFLFGEKALSEVYSILR